MVLDLIVKFTNDGYTAEVPSITGCECWAHDEDTVINKILELSAFYLNIDVKKIKIDKAMGTKHKQIFKLVFNKSN
ncbi:MAG: hypothetical protein CO128_10875 [Ignavibacteriales bacterium CG_4_9_14_3_um_filter_30_11]|nr:MAG: hypothetical protein CO128_10875 [Ignavibacteriales bacterium CG_4_9_14_3_um_filter_30_11]